MSLLQILGAVAGSLVHLALAVIVGTPGVLLPALNGGDAVNDAVGSAVNGTAGSPTNAGNTTYDHDGILEDDFVGENRTDLVLDPYHAKLFSACN